MAETPLHDAVRACRFPHKTQAEDLSDCSFVPIEGTRASRRSSEFWYRRFMTESRGPEFIETANSTVTLLLKNGANVNQTNSSGQTPLIIAAEKGCLHLMQVLFDWQEKSGTKILLDLKDVEGDTALIKAARRGDAKMVEILVSNGASVDIGLHDNYGFTALHTAIYDTNDFWADYSYFRKKLDEQELEDTDENRSIMEICNILDKGRVSQIREREEIMAIILAKNPESVNAVDFRGRTPLAHAAFPSVGTNAQAIDTLRVNCANFVKEEIGMENKAKSVISRLWRFQPSPLHRLALGEYEYDFREVKFAHRNGRFECQCNTLEPIDVMKDVIRLKPELFRGIESIADNEGRTALHHVVIPIPHNLHYKNYVTRSNLPEDETLEFLLKIGCNVNKSDKYGKTALHYAEHPVVYKWLVEHGARENVKDKFGKTPKELNDLRNLWNGNTSIFQCSIQIFTDSKDDSKDQLENQNSVKLTESLERTTDTHKICNTNELKIEHEHKKRIQETIEFKIRRFVARLAAAIEEKEPRLKSDPIMFGSCEEGTKLKIDSNFNFQLVLTELSKLCEVLPSDVSPKCFVRLKLKTPASQTIDNFKEFFNQENLLLSKEVNNRFRIVFAEVLNDPDFWATEDDFELKSVGPLKLKLIRPITDKDGDFPTSQIISVNVVHCVHVDGFWPEDALDDVSDEIKAHGCNLVFDSPQSSCFPFDETCVGISFAYAETQITKRSQPVAKAAYMMIKDMYQTQPQYAYYMRSCFLYSLEAFNSTEESGHGGGEITATALDIWKDVILYSFEIFCSQECVPCYFMPSWHTRTFASTKCTCTTFNYMKRMAGLSHCSDVPATIGHDPDPDEHFDRDLFMRKLAERIRRHF